MKIKGYHDAVASRLFSCHRRRFHVILLIFERFWNQHHLVNFQGIIEFLAIPKHILIFV